MIELVNVPDVAPSVVFVVSAVVGFTAKFQTKPLVVIIGPDGRFFKIYENMQKFLGERNIISFIINDSI